MIMAGANKLGADDRRTSASLASIKGIIPCFHEEIYDAIINRSEERFIYAIFIN